MADDDAAPTAEVTGPDESTPVGEPTESAEAETAEATEAETAEPVAAAPTSHVRLALIAGLVLVLALSGLTGWLAFRAHQSSELADQREVFLQVGKQGAINLTTIDYTRVDQDVQRILDSATGAFYDEFERRSQPFAEVVKQVKSKSVGSVTEAGIKDQTADGAKVLLAVTVDTAVEGQPPQTPRSWRMLISVQQVGADAKVSNVEFVA
ncbi:Mce protein [Mycolicibacterium lacusdiani]|uniref:Mce protein n=1 Tax=Mycolicibacterium lacusdiani TaxID=2895283 RepID=UPI001F1D6C62|nr:Mce protein [Mycolicibacterium lacusdiani]